MLNEPFEKYVEEYLDWCRYMRNYTEVTVVDKGYRLRQFANTVGINTLGEVNNSNLNNFIYVMRQRDYRGSPIRANTINKRIQTIVVFVKWLREMFEIKVPLNLAMIPTLREEAPRDRIFYTREQVNEVVSLAGLQAKVAIALAFDSAARIGEIVSIRLKDIDGRVIKIIGKGRKKGYLIITDETKELIDEYIEEFKITDYLFPSTRNKNGPMIRNTMRVMMQREFYKAGYRDFHPHALRHSSATEFQKSNASVDEIRSFLRHSDTKTTQIYLHNLDGANVELYDKYRKPLAL